MRPTIKVNSKTGTLKQTRPVTKSSLLHNMSKFAAVILLTGSSFAAMSFNQEDFADANDTGIRAGYGMEARSATEANTALNTTKESSSVRNKGIYLSLPDQKSRMRADYETFRQFVLSANASIIKQAWKAPSANAIAQADVEMQQNFLYDNLSISILPASDEKLLADEEVNNHFADYAASHLVNPSGKYISQADDAMTENFELENFSITKPAARLIAKADIEVTNNFEAENNPKISMPSSELVKKADLEMGYRITFDSKN